CNGNYAWLLKEVEHYCAELERAGKYQLYLWPPHCILGSEGHTLAGVVHEARMFHSFARGVQSWVEIKGTHPLTENYSVLRPEVLTRHDGEALAQRNTVFLATLLAADAVIIAGQAASHCVKSTIDDLLGEIRAQDPDLVRKVYILTDCMSAVTVPDGKGGLAADFTPQADEALRRFADAGMHLVRSTQPMTEWAGLEP
ncbi:MAG TPA: nicotinamidase, partial [Polyangia bacterium]